MGCRLDTCDEPVGDACTDPIGGGRGILEGTFLDSGAMLS